MTDTIHSGKPGAPRNQILVIKLSALGDFIQALGAMAAIRRHHPDADITLLTTAAFKKIADDSGYFDRIWLDARPGLIEPDKLLRLRRTLIDGGFQRVYDLQNNDRTALYLRLFPRRRRPEWVGAAPGASHRNASKERTAGHALDGHRQTLALAGIEDVGIDDLSWMKGDTEKFALPESFTLLVPGSAPNHPEKRWPVERYAALARTLEESGNTPVLLGTKAEEDATGAIRRTSPACIDLTGQTGLYDIAALARKASAAVGNDTGPMHIIAATGCPSVVLFSRHTNPRRHAPKGEAVIVLQEDELVNLPASKVAQSLANISR
ncbi:MAG: glycosyltransferase family 9 protein [Alphaproteobacteria bacterium]|nr:glycosyltransferase family 9 protein [Alphaproteobacteria bacterium]